MKRIIAIILTAIMILSLSACGGGGAGSSKEGSKAEDDKKIEFDNAVLADDDTVTIKAVSFFEKEWATGTQTCFCIEVTNHTDRYILVKIYSDNIYLGDEKIGCAGLLDGSELAPGKTGKFNYGIYRQEAGEMVYVDSLEELYNLNGEITIEVYDEDKSSIRSDLEKKYPIDFSTLK